MSSKKDPQLALYFTRLQEIIVREDDLDSLIGYCVVSVLNGNYVTNRRKMPFDIMPKVYARLDVAVRDIKMQPGNEQAAYHLVCELLDAKGEWRKVPDGRGSIEERIERAGRRLREDTEKRGEVDGTRNIYLCDFSLIEKHFTVS